MFIFVSGYVRLHTSKGDLNFELHCDLVSEFEFIMVMVIIPSQMAGYQNL